MSKTPRIIDNRRPTDPAYPNFRPAQFSYGRKLVAKQGDYFVDERGDIMIATTSNTGPYCNDFVRNLTEPYFRAKYIGNRDDFLQAVSWVRPATATEVSRAGNYKQQGVLL